MLNLVFVTEQEEIHVLHKAHVMQYPTIPCNDCKYVCCVVSAWILWIFREGMHYNTAAGLPHNSEWDCI